MVSVLAPVYDSLGDIAGLVEVASQDSPRSAGEREMTMRVAVCMPGCRGHACWPRRPCGELRRHPAPFPTYEHSARETEPPLFANSTVTGIYPFTTYLMPFKADGPKPKTYRAIFVENEYLKLTYIPEFGGRIFSLYDKLRRREVSTATTSSSPRPYNPRTSWPQSGLELTGPHDLHMLTLYGEPFWANQVVHRDDGSISLVLGELDPVYQMKVNLTATLHPGIAALEIGVFCYNAATPACRRCCGSTPPSRPHRRRASSIR